MVAKISTLVYEALWLEEVYAGDYKALKEFLEKESGPRPRFLISDFLWRHVVKAHLVRTQENREMGPSL